MILSIIIPTYNPVLTRLQKTLESLSKLRIQDEQWELILVDNNSEFNIQDHINLSWKQNYRILREQRQGLTYARLLGFMEAKGELILLVDDDNILKENYAEEVISIFQNYPEMGCLGGKSVPLFEKTEPAWVKPFYGSLALRDLGNKIIINAWKNCYPDSAPIGAGMGIRKSALGPYIDKLRSGKVVIPDRLGSSLSSGGDNDIVINILKAGWKVGYFPELILQHIIPEERTTKKYLASLINNSSKSWINVLNVHQINPWKSISKWTVPLRKIKAYFIYRAWHGTENYILWRGACGIYDGLAEKRASRQQP